MEYDVLGYYQDRCWVCDEPIPPGPDFCGPECEAKWKARKKPVLAQNGGWRSDGSIAGPKREGP